jgi:hypothetical protein
MRIFTVKYPGNHEKVIAKVVEWRENGMCTLWDPNSKLTLNFKSLDELQSFQGYRDLEFVPGTILG